MPRTFDRRAPDAVKWRQVVTAAVDLVLKLRAANAGDTIHGQAWQIGMVEHYEKRARVLLSQPPKGQQAFVAEQLKRLRVR
jgi:hypothetical protein